MATSRALDDTFKFSVILKGVDGLLEAIGGLILVLVSPTTLNEIVRTLTQHELSQDPHDFVARHLLDSASALTHGGRAFAAIYLLSHGLAKVVLVIALLQRRAWAYPWMIGVLGVFIAYQCYRLTYRFTAGVFVLTVFDVFVVWLTWREWRASDRARAART